MVYICCWKQTLQSSYILIFYHRSSESELDEEEKAWLEKEGGCLPKSKFPHPPSLTLKTGIHDKQVCDPETSGFTLIPIPIHMCCLSNANIGRVKWTQEQGLGSKATVQNLKLRACPLYPSYLQLENGISSLGRQDLVTQFLVKITFLYKLVAKKLDFVLSKLQISI